MYWISRNVFQTTLAALRAWRPWPVRRAVIAEKAKRRRTELGACRKVIEDLGEKPVADVAKQPKGVVPVPAAELTALLDRYPNSRSSLPHLAAVETVIRFNDLNGMSLLPARMLKQARTQLCSLVNPNTNPRLNLLLIQINRRLSYLEAVEAERKQRVDAAAMEAEKARELSATNRATADRLADQLKSSRRAKAEALLMEGDRRRRHVSDHKDFADTEFNQEHL